MSNLRLLIGIVRRDQGEAYIDFFRDYGILSVLANLCNGTASKSMLDYLGIEKTERVMLQCMIPAADEKRILRRLEERMGINMPGSGIAMTIPVGSIGGASSLNYLMQGQDTTKDEVKKMSETPYSLIVTIANKGNVDLIMDAARSAGAKGGTVIHARGTGTNQTSKFFGLSIAAEKEMVYIVARKSDKAAIMHAIMDQAGPNSPAAAVLFALPVDTIVGLQSVALPEEETQA